MTVSDPGLILPESACRWPQVFHTQGIRLRPMTLFNPVFNCLTPIVIKRLKTQADEGLTPADEAGSVVLRQPPASKLANLFRIDVRDHALGLVTQQLGGRVTEHPPGEWLGPRTPSLREGPGSASVASGSPDPVAGTGGAGAALRSWHVGAVQFTAKICGLVGRATMADPLSGGGAFSSLSARCFLFHRLHSAVGVRPREFTSRRSELEGLGNGHTSSRTQFLRHL